MRRLAGAPPWIDVPPDATAEDVVEAIRRAEARRPGVAPPLPPGVAHLASAPQHVAGSTR